VVSPSTWTMELAPTAGVKLALVGQNHHDGTGAQRPPLDYRRLRHRTGDVVRGIFAGLGTVSDHTATVDAVLEKQKMATSIGKPAQDRHRFVGEE
jgi:hypothetical protein